MSDDKLKEDVGVLELITPRPPEPDTDPSPPWSSATHEVKKTDSEARSLLRSVMSDLRAMRHDHLTDGDGDPMYGPFAECEKLGAYGACIAWGNMAWCEDRYEELLKKEGLTDG